MVYFKTHFFFWNLQMNRDFVLLRNLITNLWQQNQSIISKRHFLYIIEWIHTITYWFETYTVEPFWRPSSMRTNVSPPKTHDLTITIIFKPFVLKKNRKSEHEWLLCCLLLVAWPRELLPSLTIVAQLWTLSGAFQLDKFSRIFQHLCWEEQVTENKNKGNKNTNKNTLDRL